MTQPIDPGAKTRILEAHYPPALQEWHRYKDSIEWRLTPKGIEPGQGMSAVALTLVRRVLDQWGDHIRLQAKYLNVPWELIVACILTESAGKPSARRNEPGYISDEKTPDKVSLGLMQVLITTARYALGDQGVDADWLLVPENNIIAGTSYINKQFSATGYDPPKVAAAYNAGGVYYEMSRNNRWKMRCYPLGTGEHIDRFVSWFNVVMAL